MGVMSCNRPNCDGIMCDVYVADVGYVCYECEKEFKEYLVKKDISPQTDAEIKASLRWFMTTEKGEYEKGTAMGVDDFFNEHNRHYRSH